MEIGPFDVVERLLNPSPDVVAGHCDDIAFAAVNEVNEIVALDDRECRLPLQVLIDKDGFAGRCFYVANEACELAARNHTGDRIAFSPFGQSRDDLDARDLRHTARVKFSVREAEGRPHDVVEKL